MFSVKGYICIFIYEFSGISVCEYIVHRYICMLMSLNIYILNIYILNFKFVISLLLPNFTVVEAFGYIESLRYFIREV